jgi:hypothetical protein
METTLRKIPKVSVMSSESILTANKSVAPLDLVSAYPWHRAVFTTYALSLSFFEAIVLDALVRGGGRESLILADVQGVRASLSEQGAHRVGKDYEVEPVSVTGGVFHPKISVFAAEEECHLLVGSGNLTFGGWGGNCEVLEHLHPSFAADAIDDAASFFELMTVTERIRYAAVGQCEAVATDLRRCIRGKPRHGNIRLIHSLDLSITEQIFQIVADLGRAERLVVAAPFWDDGSAIDRLCAAIGLDHLFVHAHPYGYVEGFAGSNWPTGCLNKVQAIQLDVLNAQGQRRLHGKIFEVICKRARVIVSGSANGTAAALDPHHNIEACVVRIQRTLSTGWTVTLSEQPEFQAALDNEQDSEQKTVGVLRAVLDADELAGEVLVPRLSGAVSVSYVTGMGTELIGTTDVSADGAFRITAPALEERSWLGGRLVIRVTNHEGRAAEGFVSVASYADITRRTGAIGRRLFALLAGTETPEDVAAIMSWFYEDPERLTNVLPAGGGASSKSGDSEEVTMISVAELVIGNLAAETSKRNRTEAKAHRNWTRFMNQIFSAFRQRRERTNTEAGTEKDEEGDDGPTPDTSNDADAAAIEKSLTVFERLFDLLLSDEPSARNAIVAFDLTHYICGRLQPDLNRIKDWVDRLIFTLLKISVPPERRDDVVATILLKAGALAERNVDRWARDSLLRMDMDFSAGIPSMDSVSGFSAVLPQRATAVDIWSRVQDIRTYEEQVRAYMLVLKGGKPSIEYRELAKEAAEEWPIMEDALTSPSVRSRILELDRYKEFCPTHLISLPASEAYKLKTLHVATAKNCCASVIVWTGH